MRLILVDCRVGREIAESDVVRVNLVPSANAHTSFSHTRYCLLLLRTHHHHPGTTTATATATTAFLSLYTHPSSISS